MAAPRWISHQAGSWLAEGGIGIDIGQWPSSRLALLVSQRFPDLIEQQLTVSQRSLYQVAWAKPQQQSLSGTLRSDILHLSAGVHLGLLINAIVYDVIGATRTDLGDGGRQPFLGQPSPEGLEDAPGQPDQLPVQQ
ncbi:MAG: hypothetical protein R2787_17035 [Saprospiraceae bacterium]